MPENAGRKTKITEDVVSFLEKAFQEGATVTEACYTAKISRDAFYNRMESDKVFHDKIKRAQEYPDNLAKLVIVRAIQKGDRDTAKWWAERKMKKEFSLKSEVESVNTTTMTISVSDALEKAYGQSTTVHTDSEDGGKS